MKGKETMEWKFARSYDFYKDLGMRESTGFFDRENDRTHYIGLYQMGEAALVDAGYYNEKPLKEGQKPGTQYNNDWTGTWTKKAQDYGVNSKDDFLANREVQEIAIREYHKKVWDNYLKDYQQREGQEVGGIKLTKAGMIGAAHLVGHGKLKKFIDSNGQTDEHDQLGTTCSEYLNGFSDDKYKVDHAVDGLIAAFKDSKVKQDAEAKVKAEADKKTKDKVTEEVERAKQVEADKVKKEQLEAQKAETDKKTAEDTEKAKQLAEQQKVETDNQAQEQVQIQAQQKDLAKAEADKKTADPTAKQGEQNKQDSEPQILLTQEAIDKITPEQKAVADKEFAEVTARYEKAQADKEAKTQEEQANTEARKQQIESGVAWQKRSQEMDEVVSLRQEEQSLKINQVLEENQKRSQHTDDFIHEHANVSGSTSANTNTTSVLDLGHHAIGTGSRPNNQGTIKFVPCDSNPDAYVDELNSGVNLIGTNQSHTDTGI